MGTKPPDDPGSDLSDFDDQDFADIDDWATDLPQNDDWADIDDNGEWHYSIDDDSVL